MKAFQVATWICLALGFAPAWSQAGFTQIVAFGDSLSDTGNVSIASGGASPPAGYYMGHYSNGPIWVEYLAGKLGVPAPTPSLAGGTDYAFGGAETGLSGLSTLGTPNIGTQVSTFLASHTLNSSQLVTVWGGANDFLHTNVTDPSILVNNLGAEITSLASAGGKFFLVPNLPQLGDLPATSSLPPATQAQLNGLTLLFNGELTNELNQLQTSLGITIYRLNVDAIVQAARSDPGAFGFTYVTQDVVDTPGLNGNAAGYLFWDNVHPTTAGHALVGNAAFAAVPEPSSIVLFLIAGGCLAVPVARGGRRRASAEAPSR